MPEHNFEEQARSAMEPFRVEPSPAVWAQLEFRLKAARRRRRAFYLFTVLGLLTGLGILQWNRQQPVSAEAALLSQVNASASASSTAEKTATETNPTENSTSADKLPLAQKTATEVLSNEGPVTAPKKIGIASEEASATESAHTSPFKTSRVAAGSSAAQRTAIPDTRKASQYPANHSGRKKTKGKSVGAMALRASEAKDAERASDARVGQLSFGTAPQIQAGGEDEEQASSPALDLAQLDDHAFPHSFLAPEGSLAVPNNRVQLLIPDSLLAVVSNVTEKATLQHKFLDFGISASIGRSAFTEGIGFTMKASADQMVSQPGSAPQPLPIPYDYRHDPALGFSVGVWMGLPLSKRWDLRVGLQYQQFSTVSPVGALVDSNRNFTGSLGTQDALSYYRAGTQEDFTNRFHVLQVPLSFSWKLNPRSALPVSWSFGLSPGWLISSNALVYDGNAALYHGTENQQRFQLGLQTGFQFHLLQKSARSIQLGPLLQYQFNQAFREGVQGNGHLYYLGLEASMPIFRKSLKQRSK